MTDLARRSLLAGAAGLTGGSLLLAGAGRASAATTGDVQNILSAAVAWRETAAERDMLFRQGFNIARERIDEERRRRRRQLRKKKTKKAKRKLRQSWKPLAIICDVDDTVLSSDTYWVLLLAAGKQAFDDALWDQWVADNGPTPTPGAVAFTQYAASRGIEVFYVSSRDQGPNTQAYGVANLAHAGLAFADDAHATFLRESSNKEPAQQAIAEKYEVIAYLGDNLNDFRRKYYVKSVAQRKILASEDAEEFGRKFIVFPNNTDGHWMRAIFGESEPADTPAYRERMLQAALNQVP